MKCFTTGSATSASSSAMRTSRSASWTLASVRRASPRIVLTIFARRVVRLSSMGVDGCKLESVPDIVIHVVASALYAGLALHFWHTRWRAQPRAAPPPACAPGSARRSSLPLALHGALLYAELFARDELRFGFAYALSAMLWLAVLFYWLESFFYDLDAMQPPVLALAALARAAAGAVSRAASAAPTPPRSSSGCTWCWRCSPTACSPSPCCTRC